MPNPLTPFPLGSMVQSLLTGQLDHSSLLRVPDLRSRTFWTGAAIGAAAVLFLKARAASQTSTDASDQGL